MSAGMSNNMHAGNLPARDGIPWGSRGRTLHPAQFVSLRTNWRYKFADGRNNGNTYFGKFFARVRKGLWEGIGRENIGVYISSIISN